MAARPSQSRLSANGIVGALVVAVATTGVVAALLLALWLGTRQPHFAWERYYPMDDGVTLIYRRTDNEGAVGPYTSNWWHWNQSQASQLLDTDSWTSAIGLASGVDLLKAAPERLEALAATPLEGGTLRSVSVTSDGDVTDNSSQQLAVKEGVYLLTFNGMVLDPPMPLVPARFATGETVEARGRLGDAFRYRTTFTVEARETLEVPAGHFDDCWRVQSSVELSSTTLSQTTESRTWYCAGVGIAREENVVSGEPGVGTLELRAVHSRQQQRSDGGAVEPQEPGLALAATPADVDGTDSFGQRWRYSPLAVADVRAAPLTVDDMLIYATEAGEILALDRATRAPRWRFQAGGGIADTPTVADGRLLFGAADRTAYALDARLGTPLWMFRTRDVVNASPVVANGLAYVVSDDGSLYALDAATGKERWRARLGGPIPFRAALAGATVIVGSDDGGLYALDSATGATRWAYSLGEAVATPPLIVDDTVYVASFDDTLHALAVESDEATGRVLWERALGDTPNSPLTQGDDLLYGVAGNSVLYAVNRHSGQIAWRYTSQDGIVGAPLRVGDDLVALRKADLLVLDPRTGAERRRIGSASTVLDAQSPLAFDGQDLYFGSFAGQIVAFGDVGDVPWEVQPLWSAQALSAQLFQGGGWLASPPLVAEGALYIVTGTGEAFRIEPASGASRRIGFLPGGEGVTQPPALLGDQLIIQTGAGDLVALALDGGKERWRVSLGGGSRSAPQASANGVLATVAAANETVAAAYDEQGRPLWEERFPNRLGFFSVGLLRDGRFIVTGDSLHAMDAATGEQLWEYRPTDGAVPVHMATWQDQLTVLLLLKDEWGVVTLDLASGTPLEGPHTFAVSGIPSLLAAPVRTEHMLVIMESEGTVLAVGVDGREKWQAEAAIQPSGPLVIHRDLLLYQSLDNRLFARSLADGSLVAELPLEAFAQSQIASYAPVIVGDTLYATGYQALVALRLR